MPFTYAVYVSFFNWSGAGPLTFAGWSNYTQIVENPQLLSAFYHAGILIAFFAVLPIVIALLLVALMTRVAIRGLTFYRTILFLPQVIPLVAVAVVWEWVLGESGPVNAILRAVGAGSIAQAWLGSFTWALPAVGIIGTWIGYGFAMVIFMAGVEKIPQSLYDAARVDGAGPVREFFSVTLPGLRNEILVVAVITITSALTTFDIVYIITLGGPGTSTVLPAYSAFTLAFTNFQVGAAAAMGVALAVIVFIVALGIMALGRLGGHGSDA
ncbi:MAG: sugar ABC transporter permease [Actinomycetota bacterium]|nr:sugar ABC transporter permease [Actinomycetota bacterium]